MTQIIRDMLEISRCGVQYRSDNLAQFGLKSLHASYLTEIAANPGISQDRLAKIICINKSNVARQVAVLEEDGFVRRVPSAADKRVMELYPTEKTMEILPQINDMLMRWENCITQDLTEEEKAEVRAVVECREDGKDDNKAIAYMLGIEHSERSVLRSSKEISPSLLNETQREALERREKRPVTEQTMNKEMAKLLRNQSIDRKMSMDVDR
mgnify:CR=1 FL=1